MSHPGSGQEWMLRQSGLACFSAVTASATHQLNNLLAIVEQSAGLLDDLVSADPAARPISRERLAQIAGQIGEHAARGAQIIKRLNRFAHNVGPTVREVQLQRAVDNLCVLMQQLADLRQATIEVDLPREPMYWTGRPFALQEALFYALERFLAAAEPGDTIRVSATRLAEAALIRIEGRAPELGDSSRIDPLDRLMGSIQGTLTTQRVDERSQLELEFPCHGDNL